jgi:hypothetical protein
MISGETFSGKGGRCAEFCLVGFRVAGGAAGVVFGGAGGGCGGGTWSHCFSIMVLGPWD